MSDNRTKATVWLQLKPEWSYNRHWVNRIRVARVTMREPDETLPGCHLVKVTLDVPDSVFKHSVTITLPG